MFVMTQNPQFTVEAKGKMPGDAGEEFTFKPTFAALSATEQAKFDMGTEEGTVTFLRRVLVGIADVVDADDQPIAFDDTVREWLLDQIHTRGALVKSYFAGVYGAQLGN